MLAEQIKMNQTNKNVDIKSKYKKATAGHNFRAYVCMQVAVSSETVIENENLFFSL